MSEKSILDQAVEASTLHTCVLDAAPALRQIIHQAWLTAEKNGWHDRPRTDGEMIALMHSELSEALEELRMGSAPNAIGYGPPFGQRGDMIEGKPEGVPVELADVIIRIFDYCEDNDIDLVRALHEKMLYNAKRPYRHGGKAL